jgi:hypothetical protein
MKVFVHLWYVAEFFLELEFFRQDYREKYTFYVQSLFPPRKSFSVWDNVEECGIVGEATDDITRRMRYASWITKVIQTRACNM